MARTKYPDLVAITINKYLHVINHVCSKPSILICSALLCCDAILQTYTANQILIMPMVICLKEVISS